MFEISSGICVEEYSRISLQGQVLSLSMVLIIEFRSRIKSKPKFSMMAWLAKKSIRPWTQNYENHRYCKFADN